MFFELGILRIIIWNYTYQQLVTLFFDKYDKHIKEETEGVAKKYSVICDKLHKFTS